VHTEMLSLKLCGSCSSATCTTICYLAGQPAFDTLNNAGFGASYQNSFGEVERDTPGTDLMDFPATSFWDIKGVVTITPAPPATSGIFILTNPADSILMVARGISALPPPMGVSYQPESGATTPGGAIGGCSVLPIAIRDPVNNAPGQSAGQINTQVQHVISSSTSVPALSPWSLGLLVLVLLGVGVFILSRSRRLRYDLS